jgi:MoxR-like ATPase
MQIEIMKAALFTPYSKGRWGLPLMLWSEPGAAKTSVIEEVCMSFDLPCLTLSPGEMGEGAFGVVPVPDLKSGLLRYPAPEWTLQVKDGGVVFLDELSATPPALQPPLLGLLLAGRIGGHQLNGRTRRIAAANPPEIAAGGFDLAPPVANRMGHLNWALPTVQEHAAYMMRASTAERGTEGRTIDSKKEEARVLDQWPEAWAQAVGLETAFLSRRPHFKNKMPKVDEANADVGRAWPSDRSWEHAVRAFASAKVHGLTDAQRDEFVAAFVGEGAAGEFMNFVREADLPDPAQLLDGKIKFTHSKSRLDRTHAVLAACASLVAPRGAEKRDERSTAFYEMMTQLMSDGLDHDVMVPAVQTLVSQGNIHSAAARKVLAAVNPMLRMAAK